MTPKKEFSSTTRKKMSDAKIGCRHPKFNGWYITPVGEFESPGVAAEILGVYVNKVVRYCKSGASGYGFRPVGDGPVWFRKIKSKNNVRGGMVLAGDVSRGRKKNYYLTPKGLFGCVETACKINNFSEVELKRNCLLGKRGWNIF